MTRAKRNHGPTAHACYLVTALAGLALLVVIDVWVFISLAIYSGVVQQ